jgi:predicted Kef-type K+ transport protein
METLATLFHSIDYRDPIWIAVAYLFGFIVWQLGLPPLVGFLFAGFTLNLLGVSGGEFLNEMADIGVTLLLFTIGLKLQIKQLLRQEIWGVAIAHMLIISLGISLLFLLLATIGLPLVSELNTTSALLLGFALSFSSTVFAVKIFEEKGEMGTRYGRTAIGILIVQDIAAVVFLAASTAKLPSPWAVAIIIGLIAAKPLLIMLLKRAGHGELLILYGLVLAIGGSTLFELVSLKGDLGALFFGVLIASHPKAGELAKSLLSLKDLFLVGFFLSIGIAVMPTLDTVVMALLLMLIIPLKALLFFVLFTRFHLRARIATLTSLSLANFSEFGLIVTAIAVSNQWLSSEWLAVMAIAVVLSFIIASALNVYSNTIFHVARNYLQKLEHVKRLPEDEPLDLGQPRVIICGMGRVGSGAYEHLQATYGKHIAGFDFDEEEVKKQQLLGKTVAIGDTSNPDFWQRLEHHKPLLEMILLCVPAHHSTLTTTKAIREWGFKGRIAAITQYPDEEAILHDAGVDSTFNIYAEMGAGFAQDVLEKPVKH